MNVFEGSPCSVIVGDRASYLVSMGVSLLGCCVPGGNYSPPCAPLTVSLFCK